MAFFGRIIETILARRVTSEPAYPVSHRVPYSQRTLAGPAMTPDTAVTVSAVWACLRYLSQTVAVLPWHVMKLDSATGKKIAAATHPVDWLLYKRPNPEWSSFQFRETLTHWALRWGNGYAEIERDNLRRPIALWPIHPDRVCPERDPESGALIYKVSRGTGGGTGDAVTLQADEMFHIRGFGEGPIGVNVIAYAAESLGWAKAVQLFGAAFFGNGMNMGGFIEVKSGLKPAGLKALKAELAALFKGPRKAQQWPVLDNGMTAKPFAIEPDKAQFIETNKHLVDEVCRWFGVPPHKVMHLDRATFSNIEHQAIEVVVDSIHPWVKRFEDEADFKLFGQNRLGFYTKMNMRALLRGDFKTQQEGFEVMRRNGTLNANEWRELVDMDPMDDEDGGSKYVMQSNNTTLEMIGEPPALPGAGASAPEEAEAAPGDPGDPADPDQPAPEEAEAMERLQILAEALVPEHV
jgi:HK97 family phage portal protein